MAVKQFASADHGRMYSEPFAPWLERELVVASGYDEANAHLMRVCPSDRNAQSLFGGLVRLTACGENAFPDSRKQNRCRRDLREAGIAIDEFAESNVEIGEVIRAFLSPWGNAT